MLNLSLQVNTFQIVLVTDGQHSFTLFNYPENGIEWAASTGQYVCIRQIWESEWLVKVGVEATVRFFTVVCSIGWPMEASVMEVTLL